MHPLKEWLKEWALALLILALYAAGRAWDRLNVAIHGESWIDE